MCRNSPGVGKFNEMWVIQVSISKAMLCQVLPNKAAPRDHMDNNYLATCRQACLYRHIYREHTGHKVRKKSVLSNSCLNQEWICRVTTA